MRGFAIAVALTTFGQGAFAAGYDDFAAGITAQIRGESERAIISLTAALSAPDLVAAYRPVAYRFRADAYLDLEKCAQAKDDLKAYEALKTPNADVDLLAFRADVCVNDTASARQRLKVLAKSDTYQWAGHEFSTVAWRAGLFDESAAAARITFAATADKTETHSAYLLLWQAMSALRAGHLEPAEISASLAETRLSDWPKPVFSLFFGKISPQELAEEATSSNEVKDAGQRCEANFYSAEWYLSRGDKAAATAALLAAARICPENFTERRATQDELKRLGVPLPKE